jgi:hypothetical protein
MTEHFLKRDRIALKPGDVVRFYDELKPDERAAVDTLRGLGPTGVLDMKATILEKVASAARNTADAAKLLDDNPGLIPIEERARPTYALAQLFLLTIAVCMLGVLVSNAWDRAPHPPPQPTIESTRPGESGESKRATRSRKGGAEVANVW